MDLLVVDFKRDAYPFETGTSRHGYNWWSALDLSDVEYEHARMDSANIWKHIDTPFSSPLSLEAVFHGMGFIVLNGQKFNRSSLAPTLDVRVGTPSITYILD